ncbi:MAG: 2OG-Fe(II) oxygenase [Magnetococcales bacterium]|nr:2OG-Fe(II) oxygenase [Magnetococcales bacterium]
MKTRSTINAKFSELLDDIQRAGDFFFSGRMEIHTPLMEVAGVGPIALPLLPFQAQQLIAIAEQAPYGRGMETLVDTSVRRTWQIPADHVQIRGQRWTETLEAIVGQVTAGLGIGQKISSELYKLLVYDEGSFFLNHRDTEKVDGMFATLVIVLPSLHGGGELIVRHRNRQVQLDLNCSSPSEVVFAAFYADCKHEVKPVTLGFRLVLIYNLLFPGTTVPPEPPDDSREERKITALLREWVTGKRSNEDTWPEKLVYPLEHAYTEAGVSFASLKGKDAARASVLRTAAREAECELHLALLSIEESGVADYVQEYRSRRGWHEEPDLEVGEVCDRNLALKNWRNTEDNPVQLGTLPFLDEELSPENAFDEIDPDELEFEEASGNEGPSFERLYQCAALVLWPKEQRLAVICQGGLAVTLPFLQMLADQWIEGGQDVHLPQWRQAHELAGHMISSWPDKKWFSWPASGKTTDESSFLSILAKLRDEKNISIFLTERTAQGVYSKADNLAMLSALAFLDPVHALKLIDLVISGNARRCFGGCTQLLRSAIEGLNGSLRENLLATTVTLVDALPGDGDPPSEPAWRRPDPVTPEDVADLVLALGLLGAAPSHRAADHILSNPKTYDLDKILVPATLAFRKKPETQGMVACQRLLSTCLTHLKIRIAEPLEPPNDWKRKIILSCQCMHCRELERFLADPKERQWAFRAAEAKRKHVESIIARAGCDLDFKTERRGSPHTLLCTKNQASYENRIRQRRKDLEDLAQLERRESA